jgi:hypothetical protein
MSASLIQPYQNLTQVSFDFWAKPVFQNSDGTYWTPGCDGATYMSNPDSIITIGGGSVPSVAAGQVFALPGLCTVHCHTEYAVDKKKPIGSNGERVTLHGVNATDIDIEVMIWTPEQLRQLRNIVNIIFPGNKGNQQARDVSHPTFTTHGVKSMIVLGIDGPNKGPVVNSRVFNIRGISFAKPNTTNVTTTPVGAKPLATVYDPTNYPTPGSNSAHTGP